MQYTIQVFLYEYIAFWGWGYVPLFGVNYFHFPFEFWSLSPNFDLRIAPLAFIALSPYACKYLNALTWVSDGHHDSFTCIFSHFILLLLMTTVADLWFWNLI